MNMFENKKVSHEMEVMRNGTAAQKLDVIAKTHNSDVLALGVEDRDYDVRCAVAISDYTNPEDLSRLAEDAHPGVRMLVAGNLNIPQGVLYDLYKHDEIDIVSSTALENARATELMLLDALEYGTEEKRFIAACHDGATQKVLSAAVKNADAKIRQAAAANLNADHTILHTALLDVNVDVRKEAGMNNNMTEDLLRIALSDGNEAVRAVAALNINTTNEMVLPLYGDPSPAVKAALMRREKVLAVEAGMDLKEPIDYIARQVGDRQLTYAQRDLLLKGRGIILEDLKDKNGNYDTYLVYIRDNKYYADPIQPGASAMVQKKTSEKQEQKGIRRKLGF